MSLFTRWFNKIFKKGQFSRRQGRRNFGKKEELKKDPIICFKCKRSGHIKIDRPKLRRDKKSSKEKFKKFKKAFTALGESDVHTTENEPSDQEVANLCLVAKEDDINELYLESNSFNDLQDDYNDLYEESLNMMNTNCMLKKQVASLSIELENSKKHVNELTSENDELNARIVYLTKCLEKYTTEQKVLDYFLDHKDVSMIVQDLDIIPQLNKNYIKIYL